MGNYKYSIEDWRAVRRGLGAGGTIRGVAAKTGVNREAVFRWSRADEPPEWMWHNMETKVMGAPAKPGKPPKARLTYEDRVIVFAMTREGKTNREIADAVGCHRTTVARELARCPEGEYDPRAAQRDAWQAARRPKERKLDANPRLRAYVVNGLMLRWSPEQISARVRDEFPDDEGMRVSCETIYQALYVQGKGQLRDELGVQIALRSGSKRRKPRSKLPARGKPWVEGREIELHPDSWTGPIETA